MYAPVNQLGHKVDEARTCGRALGLLVDRVALIEHLERGMPLTVRDRVWHEKRDALVQLDELEQSLLRPGFFSFLSCAHCKIPSDLNLRPFQVHHDGDFIVWDIRPPGADTFYEDYELVRFRFHRSQYEKAIQKMLLSAVR